MITIVLGKMILFIIFSWLFIYFIYSYLNNWDKKLPNLDVADDYRSERQEILKVQGKNFPFSFGDVSLETIFLDFFLYVKKIIF